MNKQFLFSHHVPNKSKPHKKSMQNYMAKQRITEGAILEINIDSQYYVYAQILTKGLGYAFFDLKSKLKIQDLTLLQKANILFIVTVYSDIITQGVWVKVGKLPIRNNLLVQPMKYIQDIQNPKNFELYNPNTGEITKATTEQCVGLECAAVWEANHVVDRIKDYYLGQPNIWVEQLKIK